MYFEGIDKQNEIHDLCMKLTTSYKEDKSEIYNQIFRNIGENSDIIPPFMVDGRNVCIGDNCVINHHLTVLGFSKIDIGNNVGISSGVTLIAIDHKRNPCTHGWNDDEQGPITIKDGAWIGANVTILPNVTIGENAIVGAGSVVTKDVPPNTTVMGNPAKSTT